MSELNSIKGNLRNPDRHIWEGWTVSQFVRELYPLAVTIKEGNSWIKPFESKEQVKNWCKDNQPYYKKNIPEVTEYFIKFFEV